MGEAISDPSPSQQAGAKAVHALLQVLNDAGGQLPGRKAMEKVEERIELTAWEKERYEKSGNIRWQSILHFYTIGLKKAGFLRKQKGVWILTEDGEKALELSPVELSEKIRKAYKKWEAERQDTVEEDEKVDISHSQEAKIDQLEEEALEGLREYVKSKNPYEFQDMVAALLRAMDYYTPYISPKGKDSGLDVIAYKDPIGATSPRIKVQVKHRPDAHISVEEVRSLSGLLNPVGDVGLFVTSGHFSSDADSFARNSTQTHVELIDFERFIELWQEHYDKLGDEEKNMLPLKAINFLGSNE